MDQPQSPDSTPHHHVFTKSFLLAGLLLSFYYYLVKPQHAGKKLPPGSFGLPVFGESLYFQYYLWTNRLHLFTRLRRAKYGDIFKSRIFGKRYVVVCGAKAGRMMTALEHKTFQAHQLPSANQIIGPRSVLLINGEQHKQFRSLTSEAFSPQGLKVSMEKIEHIALDVLNSWEEGDVVLVEHESIKFAFNIIASLTLSWMPGPVVEKAAALARVTIHGMFRPPINIPGFAFHKDIKAREELVTMFNSEIEDRISNNKEDILQTMLNARDAQGKPLSRHDITDNLLTYIIAGHETTSASISFIVQLLDEHPHILEQLRAEHEAIHNEKTTPNAPLTWEDYRKMSFTEKVINEAARISSIINFWHRRVAEDFEFEGYQIPKGWNIIFDLKATHEKAEHFADPDTFNPSKFDQPPKPYSFMPWGGGPRICLGMNLAKLEMAIFLHHLTLKYRWKQTLPNLGLDYFGVPRPKGGVPILIKEKVALNVA